MLPFLTPGIVPSEDGAGDEEDGAAEGGVDEGVELAESGFCGAPLGLASGGGSGTEPGDWLPDEVWPAEGAFAGACCVSGACVLGAVEGAGCVVCGLFD
jgi:hypothetical protein